MTCQSHINMTLLEIKQKLEPLALRVIEGEGMEFFELNVAGHPNDVLIQITADKPNGGINIHECAILNKSLVAAIEQEQVLPPEVFSLELSSPGLDRPLITRRDFLRFTGQEIHFWLNTAVNGKKEAEGILSDVTDTDLVIEIKKKQRIVLPLSSIIKGVLVI